jgi:hypothetical protein
MYHDGPWFGWSVSEQLAKITDANEHAAVPMICDVLVGEQVYGHGLDQRVLDQLGCRCAQLLGSLQCADLANQPLRLWGPRP